MTLFTKQNRQMIQNTEKQTASFFKRTRRKCTII